MSMLTLFTSLWQQVTLLFLTSVGAVTVTDTGGTTLSHVRTLQAAAGSVAVTVVGTVLDEDHLLVAAPGAVSLAAYSAQLSAARGLITAPGTIALFGYAAQLTVEHGFSASTGSLIVTRYGSTAELLYQFDAGFFTLTFEQASFTIIPAPAWNNPVEIPPVPILRKGVVVSTFAAPLVNFTWK